MNFTNIISQNDTEYIDIFSFKISTIFSLPLKYKEISAKFFIF